MKVIKAFIYSLIILCFSTNVHGQELSPDPALLHGKLENGISYYIKNNKNPENIVELRLIVNIGSVYENDAEQGFAHFVEHMCFNGTKNFPNNEVISTLESKGMRFGRQFNAYTSFAETVYQLTIPVSENKNLLNTGFQVLEDWAHQVTFEDKEIEKERGVILQELRTGQGSDQRLRNQFYPALFRGARYQCRLPIGKKDILENFKPDELRNFYKKWYRPELMSVVVVGDIEIDEAKIMVNKYFGRIQKSTSQESPKNYLVSNNDATQFVVCTDKEANKEIIRMYFLEEPKNIVTKDDFRESLINELVIGIINRRFQELNQKSDAPFVYSRAGIGDFVRTKDAFTYTGVAKRGMLAEATKTMFTENQRLILHGFNSGEMEMEQQMLINQYKDYKKEKKESKDIAKDYTRSCLRELQIQDPFVLCDLAFEMIPGITMDELNKVLKSWIGKQPLVVASLTTDMLTPEITEAGIEKIYLDIKNSDPGKYIVKNKKNSIDVSVKTEGKVVSEKYIEKYGITEWVLSNGAKVVLKPTTFKNDEILFTGISQGGYSLYSDKDFVSAVNSFRVGFMSGISGLSFSEMRNLAKIEGARLAPWMNEQGEGTRGGCNSEGIETLLKLNYLYFTELKGDSIAAKTTFSKSISQIESMKNEPDYVFSDTLTKIFFGADSRKLILSNPANYDQFNLDRANQIIKERFSNPSDFTFVFVGNFDNEKIKPLIEKYIGGLNGEGEKEKVPESKYFNIKSSKDITVYSGEAKKSLVQISYFGEIPWTRKSRSQAKVLTEVLKIKLRKALREDKSGVYGVSVASDYSNIPEDHFRFSVNFGCSTAMVNILIDEVDRQIELIKTEGPDAETLDKVKALLSKENAAKIKKNRYWQNKLADIYCFEKEMDTEIEEYLPSILDVTSKQVQKTAIKQLNKKQKVIAKMYPEAFNKPLSELL
ncbi:MAG: insulinase family protein [Bacteroidales bacterium]|nr:insulinase family protein [Bacteroidales bacterium]